MKRILVAALAACLTAVAFGATTLPPSMINPTGSTAGQAILSTGSTGQPVWGAVPLSGITGTLAITNGGTGATTQAAALANLLGSSTVPIANGGTAASTAATARTNLGLGTAATANTGTSGATVPLLSTANTWTLAQAFTVRPTFNGATPWDSSNLASPASTASPTFTGTVTTAALTATGLITPSTTSGIKGTTAADSANAGSVGEYISSAVGTNTAITASGSAQNCTSISLTAGDWDVGGGAFFAAAAGSGTWTGLYAGISATSVTLPSSAYLLWQVSYPTAITANEAGTVPTQRVNVSATTTIYLIVQATYSSGTMNFQCNLWARRRR
ncbi:hypothetical protein [Paraburkholderia sp. SIMBA_027]|uniref:hypothetical protein n=2 Tax=Bacteria TaxID=2 RepID=UPI00397A6296